MAGTATGLSIRQRILDGTLNASSLETELATATNKAAFIAMMNDRASALMLMENTASFNTVTGSATAFDILLNSSQAMKATASSDTATDKITASGTVCKAVLSNINGFNAYVNNTDNYRRIKRKVNASGSKLKRQIFTTSGTFTPPVGGLTALCYVGIAGGSGGDGAGGSGGDGGEFAIKVLTSSLPSTGQTVTIGDGGDGGFGTGGDAGENTTIGAGFTCLGTGGVTSGPGKTGLHDTDFDNAFWYFENLTIAPAQGGNPTGQDGITGTGGTLGLPGNGLGSGGGGPTTGVDGVSATDPGCGGSGGPVSFTGGAGAAGKAWIYYIEA